MREKKRLDSLNILIKTEEEKKEKLEKTFKEKELESETLLNTQENELKLKEAQQKAVSKIMEEREKLKNLLKEMRNKASLEEAAMKSKIVNIRTEISSKVNQANNKGDQTNCVRGLKSRQSKEAYCSVKFKTDYVNLLKCEDSDDFCVTCCEAEFGVVFIDLRKKCLDEVCYKADKK